MKTIIALIAGVAAGANASVTINEVLGSTAGTDREFIELYNTGGSSVDISGWTIELWDSDAGAQFGGADGGTPYIINLGSSIAAGGYFTIANALAETEYGFTADQQQAISIENSAYTMVLRDALSNIIETIYVADGGAGDAANIAGTIITADYTVGPDGTFLPAGFYRIGDGSANLGILEFDQPSPSATPGRANIPAPAALAVLGLGGLVAGRRRR